MELSWNKPDPGPDPFEAAVGEMFAYQVHRAESTANSDDEIARDMEATILKAAPFARAAIGEPTASGDPVANILLLWDVVYCNLVVVCSDETMMYDASQVVKCSFLKLEEESYGFSEENFDAEAEKRSSTIKQILRKIIQNIDALEFPSGIPVLYSDQDRASVGAEHFEVESLMPN